MRRAGVTLPEVLVGVAIAVMLIVPTMGMLLTANKVSFAANRMVEMTLYGQMLLEALQSARPSDFDDLRSDPDGLLVDVTNGGVQQPFDMVPGGGGGDRPVREHISDLLAREPAFPYTVRRQVWVRPVAGSTHMQIEIALSFERLPSEPGALHTLVLRGTLVESVP